MLDADSISKSFGSTRANDSLTLSIRPGEIVGLLGENGAGKSTFLSILAGRLAPDRGELRLDGNPVVLRSPRDARRLGISIVFQHFSLVPTFTIREQLRLAGWASPELPAMVARRFSGDEVIGRLSPGEQQVVEIARALVSNPRLLLLDEPTSILTRAETGTLFDTIGALRDQGTSVVLVTHKLREAMAICDRIVVIRRGRTVDEVARGAHGWPDGCEDRLLAAMFGPRLRDASPDEPPRRAGAPDHDAPARFRIDHLSTRGSTSRLALHDVSLEVRRGEISAIVGIDGQGQRELAAVCAGYASAVGMIELDGRALPSGRARVFRRAGVTYLTGDRMGEGTLPGFPVESNLILKRQRERAFSRAGLLRRGEIRRFATAMIDRWGIVPPRPAAAIGSLSGGNIQKVMLARELSIATTLFVVANPSQGLDARTTGLVWSAIHRFAAAGGSVVLFVNDVGEALEHADRIGVMFEGRLSRLADVAGADRDVLERMMVAGWS